MTTFDNEQIKLSKVHTKPRKGYKLGTATATLKKLRAAASSSSNGVGVNVSSTKTSSEASITSEGQKKIYDNGENGELIILFCESNKVEVWDWYPPSLETKVDGDTMYLHAQVELFNNLNEQQEEESPFETKDILSFNFVRGALKTGMTFLLIYRLLGTTVCEVHSITHSFGISLVSQKIYLPSYLCTSASDPDKLMNFTVKLSSRVIAIANEEGFIYVFRYHEIQNKYLPANHDFNLGGLKKVSSQPIISKHNLVSKVGDEELLLQTSCLNGIPIFDVVGNWLAYSPVKSEYEHIKTIKIPKSAEVEDFDPILTTEQDQTSKKVSMFTPVKLPPPGPLLNRVLSTLSNTALDSLFKLSEVSSCKVRAYLNRDTQEPRNDKDMAQSLNSFGKALSKLIYSTASTTASTIQKSTRNLTANDNQLIKIIDLMNDEVMTTFKPQGGVSCVSLSRYDLQLVHASLRGDHLFMWDLCKLPREIAFVGKFTRGKTSAIIENIFWFMNTIDNATSGINSGFGCTTKSTGTVHWFNINYLSGNCSNNYPKTLGKEDFSENVSEKFLDSWILPSLGAVKFLKLPLVSNADKITNNSYSLNQLGIIDDEGKLKLISNLNGNSSYQYKLPQSPVNRIAIPLFNPLRPEKISDIDVNYLSQAEIETCSPYMNLARNQNVTFAVFKFKDSEKTDFDNLTNSYSEFGHSIPTKKLNFHRDQDDATQNVTDPDILDKLINGLTIDQGEF
ncbi:uncharacterized protein PRCAT00005628001 [Priceomyces carsonii]|uniref:uncharacterized protein n=1 Tax=Priceomyces carsonii TaxID=28549 RepID=UPI002EDA750E|nr:unnamed protein product [Priceomyces carsonii]